MIKNVCIGTKFMWAEEECIVESRHKFGIGEDGGGWNFKAINNPSTKFRWLQDNTFLSDMVTPVKPVIGIGTKIKWHDNTYELTGRHIHQGHRNSDGWIYTMKNGVGSYGWFHDTFFTDRTSEYNIVLCSPEIKPEELIGMPKPLGLHHDFTNPYLMDNKKFRLCVGCGIRVDFINARDLCTPNEYWRQNREEHFLNLGYLPPVVKEEKVKPRFPRYSPYRLVGGMWNPNNK